MINYLKPTRLEHMIQLFLIQNSVQLGERTQYHKKIIEETFQCHKIKFNNQTN